MTIPMAYRIYLYGLSENLLALFLGRGNANWHLEG